MLRSLVGSEMCIRDRRDSLAFISTLDQKGKLPPIHGAGDEHQTQRSSITNWNRESLVNSRTPFATTRISTQIQIPKEPLLCLTSDKALTTRNFVSHLNEKFSALNQLDRFQRVDDDEVLVDLDQQGDEITNLNMGVTLFLDLVAGESRFYKIPSKQRQMSINLHVKHLDGAYELYLSKKAAKPSRLNHDSYTNSGNLIDLTVDCTENEKYVYFSIYAATKSRMNIQWKPITAITYVKIDTDMAKKRVIKNKMDKLDRKIAMIEYYLGYQNDREGLDDSERVPTPKREKIVRNSEQVKTFREDLKKRLETQSKKREKKLKEVQDKKAQMEVELFEHKKNLLIKHEIDRKRRYEERITNLVVGTKNNYWRRWLSIVYFINSMKYLSDHYTRIRWARIQRFVYLNQIKKIQQMFRAHHRKYHDSIRLSKRIKSCFQLVLNLTQTKTNRNISELVFKFFMRAKPLFLLKLRLNKLTGIVRHIQNRWISYKNVKQKLVIIVEEAWEKYVTEIIQLLKKQLNSTDFHHFEHKLLTIPEQKKFDTLHEYVRDFDINEFKQQRMDRELMMKKIILEGPERQKELVINALIGKVRRRKNTYQKVNFLRPEFRSINRALE
eukprot:TRINITY_DN2542_c0_g1_i2.p1 TRINITY_DN2542_c0_g1~~TRINITY_DN2542_c0_g1_i2.p1  ORF type:complete len:611 (-),score=105.32 TRINITY_DN2542_c0_g1_i2:238-2070(-)